MQIREHGREGFKCVQRSFFHPFLLCFSLLGDDRAPVSVSGILLNPHGATGLQEVDEGEVASMQIQKA
jgi:hypothetical protein